MSRANRPGLLANNLEPPDDPELDALIAELSRSRGPRSKYHNIPTRIGAHVFASRHEAERYRALRLLERAGEITDLELQPAYVLHAPRINAAGELAGLVPIGKYIADFRYRDVRTGALVVEDAKGVRTAVYKLKCRFMLAEYGIEIREV